MQFFDVFVAFLCVFATCESETNVPGKVTTVMQDGGSSSPVAVTGSVNTSVEEWPKKGRKVSDQELQTFFAMLFENDVQSPSRLGVRITASLHNQTTVNSTGLSSGRLKQAIRDAAQNGSRVFDEDDYVEFKKLLAKPTYRGLYDLFNNYEPQLSRAEVETAEERAEMDRYLSAIFATRIANLTFNFLRDTGRFTMMQQLRDFVVKTWFTGLKRGGSKNVVDSSAFEHVFVGEHNAEKLTSGFHNWMHYLVEERAGNTQYCGWHESNPHVLSMAFIWRNSPKLKTSIFLNTSPEVEIFAHTTCFLLRPDNSCPFNIDPMNRIMIKNDYIDQRDKRLISAYPVIIAAKKQLVRKGHH